MHDTSIKAPTSLLMRLDTHVVSGICGINKEGVTDQKHGKFWQSTGKSGVHFQPVLSAGVLTA